MCDELLQLHNEDDEFLLNVFWSDEATFHLTGRVNLLGYENPKKSTTVSRASTKVNFWVAMS